MKVRDAMSTKIQATRADEPVSEAARRMAAADVGGLPVIDGDRLVGFVTDRDITIRATAEGRHPDETPVADVMSKTLVICQDDDDVSTAAEVMKRNRVRRLLVTDKERRPTGILSLGDLARSPGEDGAKAASDALCAVCEPATT